MKIVMGIPETNRGDAAALYWEAFGEKLGVVMGPQYRALIFINNVMRMDHGICALDDDGELLGIVGFKTIRGALVGGDYSDIRKVYGYTGGAIRVMLLAALENDTENERFLIDGIVVAPKARGRGVGTALLHAAAAEAKSRGYRQIRLDVTDTNPRARALYAHEGFKERGTHSIGIMRYVFKFHAAITMVRDL